MMPAVSFFYFWIYLLYTSRAAFVYESLSSNAAARGAVCLDGSTPGYIVRDDGVTKKWIVYLQWGGWCISLADCLSRANTSLGSSKTWSLMTQDPTNVYILSDNTTANPHFAGWNAAYVPYCDGSSFSSDLALPVDVNGTNLFFRGARILQETFNALFQRHNLDATSELIVTGCSAGSLSSYLHANLIQSWFKPTVKFAIVPDSGFFMNYSTFSAPNNFAYADQMRWVHDFMNCSLDARCVAAQSSDPARCILAETVVEYISAPVFHLMGLYDEWSLYNILGFDSPAWQGCAHGGPTNCTQHEIVTTAAVWSKTQRRRMLRHIKRTDAYFLDSCWSHCAPTQFRGAWLNLEIGGVVVRDAVAKWWASNFTHTPRLLDCPLTTNGYCNPTCNDLLPH